jgi:uncharacterized protein YegP (UPF0339 family)
VSRAPVPPRSRTEGLIQINGAAAPVSFNVGMGNTKPPAASADRHVWIVFRSYSGEWRWEERDEASRVIAESSRGFTSRAECLHDAALHGEAPAYRRLH